MPYLIAEIGSNHNGIFRRAKRLAVQAAESGADAVKFQLFKLETLIQPKAFEKALSLTSSAWQADFKKLEFPLAWLPRLKRLTERLGVDFLCTPFDEQSLEAYAAFQPAAIKIASGDITHRTLLLRAAHTGIPVIASTGASNEAEIAQAFALLNNGANALLECVMRYPAENAEYSLERLQTLQKYTRIFGVSDHSAGTLVAARAVLSGALIVEKHFTFDRRLAGADHAMSAEPDTLRALKAAMLEAFTLRARGKADPKDSAERTYARRAFYARSSIKKGDIFSEKNCIALRPAAGEYVPASSWDCIEGKAAAQDYAKGTGIAISEMGPAEK
jgi:sialic acid synthase SpsE